MTTRAGIDLGGTKVQTVIVDDAYKVLGEARQPTPTTGGPKGVAEVLIATVREAAEQAGVAPGDLAGIGIGSPGVIDARAGTVSAASNLPRWSGTFALGGALEDALGPPVSIDNDVNVATAAEFHLGSGRPYQSLLGVFWGTGVGGGIVIDGKPWSGRGAAGEIGHVVVKVGGAHCPCGRRGCMEAYAGRLAMERRARKELEHGAKTKLFKIMEERGRTRLTSGVWARALKTNDALAVRLVDRAVEALGAGVASSLNVLDVEAVVFGGGLGIRLGQPFVDRITDAMQPHLFASANPPMVHLAALGDLGGALGAALLSASTEQPSAARERIRVAS